MIVGQDQSHGPPIAKCIPQRYGRFMTSAEETKRVGNRSLMESLPGIGLTMGAGLGLVFAGAPGLAMGAGLGLVAGSIVWMWYREP